MKYKIKYNLSKNEVKKKKRNIKSLLPMSKKKCKCSGIERSDVSVETKKQK